MIRVGPWPQFARNVCDVSSGPGEAKPGTPTLLRPTGTVNSTSNGVRLTFLATRMNRIVSEFVLIGLKLITPPDGGTGRSKWAPAGSPTEISVGAEAAAESASEIELTVRLCG